MHIIVVFPNLLWRMDVFLQAGGRTFLFLKKHLTMTSLSDKIWRIQSGTSEVLMRPAMLHYSLTGQQRVIFPSLGCSVSTPSRLHGHPLSGTLLCFSRRRAKDSEREWQSNQVAREFTRTSSRLTEQVERGTETGRIASLPWLGHMHVSFFHPLPQWYFTLSLLLYLSLSHTHNNKAHPAGMRPWCGWRSCRLSMRLFN